MRMCSKCQKVELPKRLDGRKRWCSLCDAQWEASRSKAEVQAKLHGHFDQKVDTGTGCWRWLGARSNTGYGSIGVSGKTCHAHRIAYERYVGPIPPGFSIDYLCRNRACVNPTHMQAVPQKVNIGRGKLGALKTHCAQGHPWTVEHIYIRPGSGKKMCRTCAQDRNRSRTQKLAVTVPMLSVPDQKLTSGSWEDALSPLGRLRPGQAHP